MKADDDFLVLQANLPLLKVVHYHILVVQVLLQPVSHSKADM